MFRWEKPEYLYLLLLIPLFWAVLVALRAAARRRRIDFIDKTTLERISGGRSAVKPYVKMLWWSLALAFFIMALANPQMGTKVETVHRKGADIVFTLDVSRSMLAEDVKPNRLEKAKRIISQMIDRMVSDRTGIIVYAGEAVPVLPITTDYAAAKMFLQQISPDMVSTQGTALDEALRLAQTYFDRDEADKILIILSDGEDHSQAAVDAAGALAEQGIKVIAVGIGSDTGAPIPIRRHGQLVGYKTDRDGQRVISRRNRELLYEIARKTGGIYVDGNNTMAAVKQIMDYLKKINRKEYEEKRITGYKDRFPWMIGAALFFLLLCVLTTEKETAWLRRLNLFNENAAKNED